MGYRLNRLDEPIFMAVPKPMLTESGIHYILESCDNFSFFPIYDLKLHNVYRQVETILCIE